MLLSNVKPGDIIEDGLGILRVCVKLSIENSRGESQMIVFCPRDHKDSLRTSYFLTGERHAGTANRTEEKAAIGFYTKEENPEYFL